MNRDQALELLVTYAKTTLKGFGFVLIVCDETSEELASNLATDSLLDVLKSCTSEAVKVLQ